MVSTQQLLVIFVSTFILVGMLTPLMRKIALKSNFLDQPDASHKSHSKPIPYLGGLAIMVGILIVVFAGVITQDYLRGNLWVALSVFFPASILGVVGLIDDRKNLTPITRFVAQSSAGLFTSVVIVSTETVGNPTGNMMLDAIITVLWIVGLSNSINFLDNLDGAAAGTIAVVSFGLFLITKLNNQFLIAATSLAIFSAMLGFLIWNKSPAKIYMGDAGSLFLGTLLATLTLRLEPQVEIKAISFSIPIILIAIPLLDTSVAILSRLRRKRSIFQGGLDHLSHRLIRQGMSKKNSAYTLWLMASIFTGIAVLISLNRSYALNLVWLAVTLWFALLIIFLSWTDE